MWITPLNKKRKCEKELISAPGLHYSREVGFLPCNIRRNPTGGTVAPPEQNIGTAPKDTLECFLEQHSFQGSSEKGRRWTRWQTNICNAKNIVKVMLCVKVVTTILCEEEQPTFSIIDPLKAKRQRYLEVYDEDSTLITQMKRAFNNDLRSKPPRSPLHSVHPLAGLHGKVTPN